MVVRIIPESWWYFFCIIGSCLVSEVANVALGNDLSLTV
jgi:hypothetical protein